MLVLRIYFWVFSLSEEELLETLPFFKQSISFASPGPTLQRLSSHWAKWELWGLRALAVLELGMAATDRV